MTVERRDGKWQRVERLLEFWPLNKRVMPAVWPRRGILRARNQHDSIGTSAASVTTSS